MTLPSLLRNRLLLVALCVWLRCGVLISHQPSLTARGPQGYDPALVDSPSILEHGITTTGDFRYYYGLARLSDAGLLPYRDYWYEFPPVFPALSLTIYHLVTEPDTGYDGYAAYAIFLALAMIAFDAGNLVLIGRIGRRLHGEATGLALMWLYAVLNTAFMHVFFNFEPMVAFFVLLALDFLTAERDLPGTLAIVMGACAKLYPLILLGAVWRVRQTGAALRITLGAVILSSIVLAGMFLANREYGTASLLAQFNKASYGTVWALLDGNHRTGLFDPNHKDVATAYTLQGSPAVVPWWARGVIFGALGALIYARTRRFDARGLVAFVAITLVIFFLWSQGWSWQWMVVLFPLVILCLPNQFGALYCFVFAAVSFAEYPLLYSFGFNAETGQYLPSAQPLFVMLIVLRALLLVILALKLYGILRTTAPRASGAGTAAA